jgi:hypothetical protein
MLPKVLALRESFLWHDNHDVRVLALRAFAVTLVSHSAIVSVTIERCLEIVLHGNP